jgi:hypothetical protein
MVWGPGPLPQNQNIIGISDHSISKNLFFQPEGVNRVNPVFFYDKYFIFEDPIGDKGPLVSEHYTVGPF